MKTSQFYWNEENQRCEIWHEEVNGEIEYWLKANGISRNLTKRQYKAFLKKYNLKNTLL